MLRLYLIILISLMLLGSGCVMAPGDPARIVLTDVDRPEYEMMRISFDDAVRLAEEPIYLIIGRDMVPDQMASSWIILSADPNGGYVFFFITADGVRSSRWEGTVPGSPINPEEFPFPDSPAAVVIFPEEAG